MASNGRPQFKHPIPTAQQPVGELTWITEEELTEKVQPDTSLKQVVWRGLKVIVRHMISLEEMQKLVGIVWEQCWDEARLCRELMDFQLRCAVVTFYTNVNLPAEPAEQYEYLYGTDLYETVRQNISDSQINAITESLKMYMNG